MILIEGDHTCDGFNICILFKFLGVTGTTKQGRQAWEVNHQLTTELMDAAHAALYPSHLCPSSLQCLRSFGATSDSPS